MSRPARVLVLDDDWLIAADTQGVLEGAGCEVLGPVATVACALRLIAEAAPDAAVLDVHLTHEMSFAVAEALIAREVPFVFLSGFTARDLPERFRDCPLLAKPLVPDRLIAALDLQKS